MGSGRVPAKSTSEDDSELPILSEAWSLREGSVDGQLRWDGMEAVPFIRKEMSKGATWTGYKPFRSCGYK
jgi:hypothetical protein